METETDEVFTLVLEPSIRLFELVDTVYRKLFSDGSDDTQFGEQAEGTH